MARSSANPLPIGDTGVTVSCSLKKRGDIYRCQFPDPDAKGKYREVSTGRRTPHEAWAEALKIVNEAYHPSVKPTAKSITWAQVVELLPTFDTFKSRTIDSYREAVNLLQEFIETKGPADVTEERAKQFRHKFQHTTYTRSKKAGSKIYTRSARRVVGVVVSLSAVWGHLKANGYAAANPWPNVPLPTVPKKAPVAPTEEDFNQFFAWADAKGWELMSVFLRVKALAGCRTIDLCSVKANQFDPKALTLTINPDEDKTHRQRIIPIPEGLAKRLVAIRGGTYLWESYTPETQARDARAKAEFRPKRLADAVRRLFQSYYKKFPDRTRIKPHDFRKRATTLTVKATGSIDTASIVLGIRADTIRRHYLDAEKAFETKAIMGKMAGILLPKAEAAEPKPVAQPLPPNV